MFPAGTPVRGLDYPKLARLGLSGGAIRNIAVLAAFRAAAADTPVTMQQLAWAARTELEKAGENTSRGRPQGVGVVTRRVNVRIGRLVIEGVPAAEARQIADSIRAALERDLQLPGAVDRLLAGSAGPPPEPAHAPPAARTVVRGANGGRGSIGAAVSRQILGGSS